MVIPTKVFIGHLPEDIDSDKLKAECEKYGDVVEFDLVNNYAFAHYSNEDDANDAVRGLNGKNMNGTKIRVELSKSRVRQKPGMGGKAECFRCGQMGHWSKTCPENPDAYAEDDGYGSRPPMHGGMYGGRGRGYGSDPYDADPYDDYYRRPLPPPLPPLPMDLFARRRLPPPPLPPLPREAASSDPYARPPPEFYARRSPVTNPFASYDHMDPYASYDPIPALSRSLPPREPLPPSLPPPRPYI